MSAPRPSLKTSTARVQGPASRVFGCADTDRSTKLKTASQPWQTRYSLAGISGYGRLRPVMNAAKRSTRCGSDSDSNSKVIGSKPRATSPGSAPRPCVQHGAAAHRAGLRRHVEGTTFQPVVAQSPGRLAQCSDLGVRRRVLPQLPLVVPRADDLAVADHDGSDRHVVVGGRQLALPQGQAHEVLVAGKEVLAQNDRTACTVSQISLLNVR